MKPRLLIDNDIFIILAGANLLAPAISLLGFDLTELRYLQPLPYIIQKKTKQNLSEEVIKRVLQCCDDIPVLIDEPSATLLQQVEGKVDIDAGEAVLYALLADRPYCLLTSNDKRAMRSIAKSESLRTVRDAVAGRVICLETVLIELVKYYGVTEISKKFEPIFPNNILLRIVFSPNCVAKPEECFFALQSYQKKLTEEVGADFLWKPPA